MIDFRSWVHKHNPKTSDRKKSRKTKTQIIMSLTKQTRNNASGNGNRYPERMLRNIEPGMANDCKLEVAVKVINNRVEIKK